MAKAKVDLTSVSMDGSLIAVLARSGRLLLKDGTNGKQLFAHHVGKHIAKACTRIAFSSSMYCLYIHATKGRTNRSYVFDLDSKELDLLMDDTPSLSDDADDENPFERDNQKAQGQEEEGSAKSTDEGEESKNSPTKEIDTKLKAQNLCKISDVIKGIPDIQSDLDAGLADGVEAEHKQAETEAGEKGESERKDATGFKLEVKRCGNGFHPKKGDKIGVHFIGALASTGALFDNTRDATAEGARDGEGDPMAGGEAFEFVLGKDSVIKGWDKAIPLMSLGERSLLHVSSALAYGGKGVKSSRGGKYCSIPPDADLVFDMELVSINGGRAISQKTFTGFRKRLKAWAAKKLYKYDNDENFRKRRNKRHESRSQYEAWLEREVASSIEDVKKLLLSDEKPSA